MDSARPVMQHVLNPHFFGQLASYDVASTIHQTLGPGHDGGVRHVH
jgi:hypothetical protein